MAVATTMSLPDQPAVGLVTYVPLGGDGWTAPHSVFEVSMASEGAAGGGDNVATVNFDPRWQSVVTYMRATNDSASGTIEMFMELLQDHSQPQLSAFANTVPILGFKTVNLMTWCPPPIPGMRRARCTVPNVDGDDLLFQFYLYNFNINVLQKVPLNLILASLPRADSVQPLTTTS